MNPPGSAKALTDASFTTWNSHGRLGRSDAFAIFMPIWETYCCTAGSL